MKYLLPLLAAVLVLFVACQPVVTPGTPAVQVTVLSTGDTLRLSWAPITDATGYYVYLDGVKNTVSATTYDVTAPVKSIEVTSYNGSEESGAWTKVASVVKTSNMTVYGIADANHNDNAFGFVATSGNCLAYDVTNQSNWPLLNFVMENRSPDPMSFWSPDAYNPVYNNQDNATAPSTTTDFDLATKAPASGVYNTKYPISSGAVYYCWIDRTNDGWSTDDNYAKVKVEAISGNQVTLTTGYQKIGGLRWLLSE